MVHVTLKRAVATAAPKSMTAIFGEMEGVKVLTPKQMRYCLTHLDAIPEAVQPTFLHTASITGIPVESQIDAIRVFPDLIEELPDISPQAQRWAVQNKVKVPELVSRIPVLSSLSLSLLKAAVSRKDTDLSILRYILIAKGKELEGVGGRKEMLLRNPELVEGLPSTIVLTPEEQEAVIRTAPQLFKEIHNPTVKVANIYKNWAKQEGVEEEIPGSPLPSQLENTINALKEARLLGNTEQVELLEQKVEQIQAALQAAVQPKASGKTQEPLTLESLIGKLLNSRYLVCNYYDLDFGESELPESVFSYLQGRSLEGVKAVLRTIDIKTQNQVLLLLSSLDSTLPISDFDEQRFRSITASRKDWAEFSDVLDQEFHPVPAPEPAEEQSEQPAEESSELATEDEQEAEATEDAEPVEDTEEAEEFADESEPAEGDAKTEEAEEEPSVPEDKVVKIDANSDGKPGVSLKDIADFAARMKKILKG